MIDDPREQAPTDDLDQDQMEQGQAPAERGLGPRPAVQQDPGGTTDGTGDR